jgi:hypothetical protein
MTKRPRKSKKVPFRSVPNETEFRAHRHVLTIDPRVDGVNRVFVARLKPPDFKWTERKMVLGKKLERELENARWR